MKRIKIFLSDPQVLFREGIQFVLSGEEDFEVTGETTNNEEALAHIEANPPQIAVLNAADAKIGGPDIARRLKRTFPSLAVILTIEKRDEDEIFRAMRSGASACLTKDADPEQLLDTVRAVSQDSPPIAAELLTPAVAARTLAEFEDIKTMKKGMANFMATLTPKETQILEDIAGGSAIVQLATKMGLDEEMIRGNLKTVLNKLIANDQTKAVIRTVQNHFSPLSDEETSPDASEELLTREEFNRFKVNLAQRLQRSRRRDRLTGTLLCLSSLSTPRTLSYGLRSPWENKAGKWYNRLTAKRLPAVVSHHGR